MSGVNAGDWEQVAVALPGLVVFRQTTWVVSGLGKSSSGALGVGVNWVIITTGQYSYSHPSC